MDAERQKTRKKKKDKQKGGEEEEEEKIEPPFLPANLHRRVGRTSTHNNPELICLSNRILSEVKWRAHTALKTVSQ